MSPRVLPAHLRAAAYGVLCGMLLACNGNETPKPEMPAALPSAPASAISAAPSAAPVLEAAPTLALQAVRSKQGVGVRVINAGRQSVSLAAQVTLEELRGTSVVAVPSQSLILQLTCKSSGCIRLAPGAEIDGPAWLERISGERCGALIVPPSPGRYRLRVQTCGSAHSRDVEFAWPIE